MLCHYLLTNHMANVTTVSDDVGANKLTDIQVRLKYSQSDKDDWTKIEDKAERKKIQNRLAKRKSRMSNHMRLLKLALTHSLGKNEPKVRAKRKKETTAESASSKDISDVVDITVRVVNPSESKGPGTDIQGDGSKTVSPAAPLQDHIDDLIQSIFTIPGLAEHRYISLTEYSVLRAYIQNADLLAIGPQIFADDDALSPWTTSNPYPALAPYDICPTPLQLSTPHHPYIDIIGIPSLRDNILLSVLTEEQEDQLCLDIHSGAFTIWGSQPWNALGMYFPPPPNDNMVDR